MPCRLINVENPQNPFLVKTNSGMQAIYIALSYCWGHRPQTMTLKDTILRHSNRLPVEVMSKTCRDAILATYLLGYKYLWIDALCIIQNDANDRDSEIARMGDIYRYAVLTICAEGSPNAHTGLFPDVPTDPREVYPCQMTMSVETADMSITRQLTIAGSRNGEDFLHKRGWTLQEEVLTSRALVIGQGVTSWRCASATARDTDPVLKPLPLDPYSEDDDGDSVGSPRSRGHTLDVARMRKWLYGFPGTRQLVDSQGVDAGHPAFAAWYALIEGYSDRELTKITDTLLGVLGIATVLKDSLDTGYAQGLWVADLPRGLMWYVAANDDRQVLLNSATMGDKGDENSAPAIPSWSWAAVGKVRIRFYELRWVGERNTKILANVMMSPDGGGDLRLMTKDQMIKVDLVLNQYFTKWRTDRIYGSRAVHGHESVFASVATGGVHPRFPALLVDPGG